MRARAHAHNAVGILGVCYLLRLLYVLELSPPRVCAGYYINLAISPERNHHMQRWLAKQQPPFPVHRIDGVLLNRSTYLALYQQKLAPKGMGYAGCRLSHIKQMGIVASSSSPGCWYLLMEDDATGSVDSAMRTLRWFVALVPCLEALGASSAAAAARPAWSSVRAAPAAGADGDHHGRRNW